MRTIVTGLCLLLLTACCQKFVNYETSTVNVEAIEANIPAGTPIPVTFKVGKVHIDPKMREASEEIQRLDLLQNTICRELKDMPDGPVKEQHRSTYIETLVELLQKTADVSPSQTAAGFDVELEKPNFFPLPDGNLRAELKWRFKPLESRDTKAAHVIMGLTSVHDESLIEGEGGRTSKTCKEVASCIDTHAWNLIGNPAVVRGGPNPQPTELTWTAKIDSKVKIIRVWWEFYQKEADMGNVCTVDQLKPYPSDGIPFLKVVNKGGNDATGACYRIWNYSTFKVNP